MCGVPVNVNWKPHKTCAASVESCYGLQGLGLALQRDESEIWPVYWLAWMQSRSVISLRLLHQGGNTSAFIAGAVCTLKSLCAHNQQAHNFKNDE